MPGELWLNYVANGEAFSAENFVVASGGLVPHVQVYNPVSSGKRVRVRSVHAISIAVIAGSIRRHDVALPVLGLPATFIIENLLGGGATAVAEMRSDNNVAVLGSGFWQINAPAYTPAIFPPEGREWGFDLLEGQGILVQGTVSSTLIANWQWVEVDL